MYNKIKNTVKEIVSLLVNGDYEKIIQITNGVRLQTKHIEEAISQYGKNLIAPPESAYNDIDIIEIDNCFPKEWSIRFHLWTKEEKRSDLSIELSLMDNNKNFLTVELDNIHVL